MPNAVVIYASETGNTESVAKQIELQAFYLTNISALAFMCEEEIWNIKWVGSYLSVALQQWPVSF